MLNLNFIKPKGLGVAVKLTVHKTGRLGFSKSAIDLLSIRVNKYCKFATNNADANDKSVYMVIGPSGDEYSFKISKAGEYYYVKAESFLNEMNIDFEDKTKTIIFDIQQIEYNGEKIYKLKKRIVEIKKLNKKAK